MYLVNDRSFRFDDTRIYGGNSHFIVYDTEKKEIHLLCTKDHFIENEFTKKYIKADKHMFKKYSDELYSIEDENLKSIKQDFEKGQFRSILDVEKGLIIPVPGAYAWFGYSDLLTTSDGTEKVNNTINDLSYDTATFFKIKYWSKS